METLSELKADLHVHSKHSKRPSEWFLRKIGCSESYTEPVELYELARSRGMDFVTITDHNTLAGSLEIAHLPNTFMSEEVTTYFPKTGCKIHLLAYGITEKQHGEIGRCRSNIFELAAYLSSEKILHAVAHPLFSINERLSIEHLEVLVLLFKNFELNGSRDDFQNDVLRGIVEALEPKDVAEFSERHRLEPLCPEPWKKVLFGGSDDHSSLNVAGMHTVVSGRPSLEGFLTGLRTGNAQPGGRAGNPKILAHNLYSIAYQFYSKKFSLDRYEKDDFFLRFAQRTLLPSRHGYDGLIGKLRSYVLGYRRPSHSRPEPGNVLRMIREEAKRFIWQDPRLQEILKGGGSPEMEEIWFLFMDGISEKTLKRFADSILESLSGADLIDLFQTIGSIGSLYLVLAPYFVSYTLFTKDRRFCRMCREHFQGNARADRTRLKIAHFTDTLNELNGVAQTLQMQIAVARKHRKQLHLITCEPGSGMPGVTNFPPIGTFDLPEYPEFKLYYPPLLKMLQYCYEEGFNQIHVATPGPVGLAGLLIARILKLPLVGTYHTALPQYVSLLTGDISLEELTWKYVLWFYNQMEVVYAPSHATGEELVAKGLDQSKIRHYPRGIDIKGFHPSKRNGFFKSRYRLEDKAVKLLYVGRVSKEKNLPYLEGVLKRLAQTHPEVRSIVVGDGPYLQEMRRATAHLPITFTGYLTGDDLAQAYASSHIFVFPSTTDTFGNVVLEAQASGLPVIVSLEGGPKENLIHGKTGFAVSTADYAPFLNRLIQLIDDPVLRERMGKDARAYMENRSFESAYMELWESYRSSSAVGR
jgi:glycosyltransferase involved in cell wall biosynthesis